MFRQRFVAAVLGATCLAATPAAAATPGLVLTSSAFGNNDKLPLSMINNYLQNNVNLCSLSGLPGGDQSPPLYWLNKPSGTRSFVLTMFDATASFTHWGIYNIPGGANSLPANAGAASGTIGKQIVDDGGAVGYFGACPPAGVAPTTHQYLFTLYALDTTLRLAGSTNFPANSETLYKALIDAAAGGHVLATATLTGLYSTTPPAK